MIHQIDVKWYPSESYEGPISPIHYMVKKIPGIVDHRIVEHEDSIYFHVFIQTENEKDVDTLIDLIDGNKVVTMKYLGSKPLPEVDLKRDIPNVIARKTDAIDGEPDSFFIDKTDMR